MTTATIAGVEAEVRELAPLEELVRQALDHLAGYDRAVRGMVIHGLSAQGAGLRESRDKARARLAAAEDPVATWEVAVKHLEEDLADCDREIAVVAARADGPDRRNRVQARALLAEYDRERSDLVKKLDFNRARLAELRVPRDQAQAACEVIDAALEGLVWAIAADQYGPRGGRPTLIRRGGPARGVSPRSCGTSKPTMMSGQRPWSS